jgi:acyl-CoA thioesterase II
VDLYRSVRLLVPPGARGVYGGQLVANAIEAACQTIDLERFAPHSIHSTFLRPGGNRQHVYFRVRRIRDGRSFATRTVTAQQNGTALFFAVINFHCDESSEHGIAHAPDFPLVPSPDDGITLDRLFSEISKDNPSDRFRSNLKLIMNEERVPMEIRYLPTAAVLNIQQQHKKDEVRVHHMPRYCWMRSSIDFSQSPSGQTPSEMGAPVLVAAGKPQVQLTELAPARAHMLIACWCSDFFLAIAGLVPHGFPNPNVQMLLSLDHTIYFHNSHRRSCRASTSAPVDAQIATPTSPLTATSLRGLQHPQQAVMGFPVDDWFLYEVVSPFAANNRALNLGRIFSRNTGKLEMTIVQESLVRMKGAEQKSSRL